MADNPKLQAKSETSVLCSNFSMTGRRHNVGANVPHHDKKNCGETCIAKTPYCCSCWRTYLALFGVIINKSVCCIDISYITVVPTCCSVKMKMLCLLMVILCEILDDSCFELKLTETDLVLEPFTRSFKSHKTL